MQNLSESESLLANLETISEKPYSRRNFFSHAGRSLVAASIAGSAFSCKTAQNSAIQNSGNNINTNPKAVVDGNGIKLSPLDAQSERKKDPVPNPLPPDKRIGYAIVGLGHLSLNQIIPAFGQCKKSKLVALVSGDAQKAAKVAEQYGLDKKIFTIMRITTS